MAALLVEHGQVL